MPNEGSHANIRNPGVANEGRSAGQLTSSKSAHKILKIQVSPMKGRPGQLIRSHANIGNSGVSTDQARSGQLTSSKSAHKILEIQVSVMKGRPGQLTRSHANIENPGVSNEGEAWTTHQ